MDGILYSTKPQYNNFIDLSTMYRLSWFIENDEIQIMIQASVTGWYENFLNFLNEISVIFLNIFYDF